MIDELRPAKFFLDGLEDLAFEGCTRGERWNGWACPYFTTEQAQTLIQAWNTRMWDTGYLSDRPAPSITPLAP